MGVQSDGRAACARATVESLAARRRHLERNEKLRNRAIATLEQEAQILDEVLVEAAQGGVVVVPPLKEKIEKRLGKRVALSTIYRMLARHGRRKLAPDTAHPQGNAIGCARIEKTQRAAK